MALISISPESLMRFHLKLFGFSLEQASTAAGKVYYFQKKAEKPKGSVVFVHGIGANAAYFSRAMIALNRYGYNVYAPDLPGHGLTPNLKEGLNSARLFETFQVWLEETLPEKFTLIGNSLGGGLCLRYCLHHPDKVEKVIVTSPAGGFETEEEWEDFREVLNVQNVNQAKAFLKKIYHRTPLYLPLIYKMFLTTMSQPGIRQLIETTTFQDFQPEKETPANMPPILLIWGQSEKLFPTSHLKRFRKLLPEKVIIEEPSFVGHCPHLERPKWFSQRVKKFLETSH